MCIFVSHELNGSNVDISTSYHNVEAVCVNVMCTKAKCRLAAVYGSTDRTQQCEEFIIKQLKECLDSLSEVTWPVVT